MSPDPEILAILERMEDKLDNCLMKASDHDTAEVHEEVSRDRRANRSSVSRVVSRAWNGGHNG